MADKAPFTPEGVTRSIVRSTLLANGAGALLDYLYLQFLAPGSFHVKGASLRGELVFVASAVLLPLYLAAAGMWAVRRMRSRTAAWAAALAAGSATPAQRRKALGLLGETTRLTAVGWAGAALLYGVLNVASGQGVVNDVRVVTGILLGGTTTAALTYLLAERRFRPVLAVALAGEPDGRGSIGIRARLLVAWLVGSALPLAAIGLTPLVKHSEGGLVSLPVSIASLAVIGVLAGYLLTRATAVSVTEPLAAVRRVLEAVRGGDLSAHVPVDDPGEIGRLQADVNRMVSGLRERRRLEELFGRHVGEAVARRALAEEAVLGGRLRDVSVLFVDLVGSTALAASRPPDEVVTVLNRLFACVIDAITPEGGWVNKFEGDAALCVFGAPDEHADHAARALRAARALQQRLSEQALIGDVLDVGIGVASGTVVAGNVGAVDRYEYTVIGDPVNEAARLCELAKTVPSRVLASGAALDAAGGPEAARWRPCGETVLRGRDRVTVLVEPAPEAGERDQPPATAGTIETV